MLVYVFLASLLGVSAQIHSVCHSNSQDLREEEVVALVADLIDRNQDNVVTVAEIVVGFADILQFSLGISDGLVLGMNSTQLLVLGAQIGVVIDREHFVDKWHNRFGDAKDFARATFDAYDVNDDGQLSLLELEQILDHLMTVVDDGDKIISAREFREYLLFIYKTC
ncbi:uncharacterized protein LOC112563078 isoform X2 [Pomacea canaliculata]|uniref:uncharacterized protein LOC112563078 isoform X2 n=1 Tax=Pomacea canaliculata TaxID=400727 RepID=UPI000D72F27D|nr:uncharacterized protein LOC112563078 isoform X2 [Pomacea canaliculata]